MIKSRIIATGSYVPPKVLTNADLEKMVDTSDEWIISRSGIRERRIAEKEVATSDLAGRFSHSVQISGRPSPLKAAMDCVRFWGSP